MSSVRRSHTLRNNRASMPATGLAGLMAKGAAVDDLGVLQEERLTAPKNIDSLEASLRSEIFERERENDKLQNQLLTLQGQLSQRPPLSLVQELQSEKKTLDMILLGTQRENEKMMLELERARNRERTLETELRRLCGDGWQTSLNIPPAENSFLKSGNISVLGPNSNQSLSSFSLAVPTSSSTDTRRSVLTRSLLGVGTSRSQYKLPGSPKKRQLVPSGSDPDSSYMTAADKTRNFTPDVEDDDDDEEEVESALLGGGAQSDREKALEQENEMLRIAVEKAKLLVLGMEKRLEDREARLEKVVKRAEQESQGLEGKLRELDLNAL